MIAKAFYRCTVELGCDLVEGLLGEGSLIRIAWHEAAQQPVGVLDSAFLVRCCGITEEAIGAQLVLQHPVAGELRPTGHCQCASGGGQQQAEFLADLAEDRFRVTALVPGDEEIAAFRSISEVTLALPYSRRKIIRSASQ